MRSLFVRSVVAAAALGSLLFAASASAIPTTITVDTTNDTSSPTTCALRDAITSANTDTAPVGTGCAAGVGNDSIAITPTGQITLGSALPQITTSMSITGPPSGTSTSMARDRVAVTGSSTSTPVWAAASPSRA